MALAGQQYFKSFLSQIGLENEDAATVNVHLVRTKVREFNDTCCEAARITCDANRHAEQRVVHAKQSLELFISWRSLINYGALQPAMLAPPSTAGSRDTRPASRRRRDRSRSRRTHRRRACHPRRRRSRSRRASRRSNSRVLQIGDTLRGIWRPDPENLPAGSRFGGEGGGGAPAGAPPDRSSSSTDGDLATTPCSEAPHFPRRDLSKLTDEKRLQYRFLYAAEAHCLQCLRHLVHQVDPLCVSCDKNAREWAESQAPVSVPLRRFFRKYGI